jgi:hypothetical protein
MVKDGFIQVQREWYDNTIRAAQRHEIMRQRNINESKRCRSNFSGLVDIDLPENKAALARRRVADGAEFCDQQKRCRAEVEEGEVVRNRMDGPAAVESPGLRPPFPASTISSAASTVRANAASGSGANGNAATSSSTIRAPSPIPSTFADSIRGSVGGSVSGSSPIRSISLAPSVIIDPNYKLVELSDSQLYVVFGLEPNTATSFPESSTLPEDQDAQGEDEQMADATVATTPVGVAA